MRKRITFISKGPKTRTGTVLSSSQIHNEKIFSVLHRSEQSYQRSVQSVASAGALCVPWAATEARAALPVALGVAGIPALVITDAAGNVLTANGRQHLAADPLGLVRISSPCHFVT